MMNELNDTQQELLRIFKEFQRICTENSLRYFAIGGTCIGAVRHNGFIPWDDDIDVAMPYEDYKRLQKIIDIPTPFELYLPEKHKHWEHNFMKMHDSNTTFVEDGCIQYRDRYMGFYIDVMPIYGLPKNRIVRFLLLQIYDLLITINRRTRREIKDQKGIKKVFWYIGKPFEFFFSYDFFRGCVDKIFEKYPFDNAEKVLFGWRQKKSIFRKNNPYGYVFWLEDFKKSIKQRFEDTKINVPVGYDRYLRMDFPGDYMQLPPEEKRIAHHKYDIHDLSKSYKEYLEQNKNILY